MRSTLAAAVLCGLFLALGVAFIPLAGAQYDETLFASLIYQPIAYEHAISTPWGKLPLMLMTYVGALKSWLWTPVLQLAGPSYWTLRFPALAATAAACFLFFLATRRLAGSWAALLALALLVTDGNFLLSSVYDWGPVALQHLFWCLLLYSLVRYTQEPGMRWLALAGAALGLALWDKAICVWLVLGFAAALILYYPRELRTAVRARRTILGALAVFLLAALPLLYYNQQSSLRTFTSTGGWTAREYMGKAILFDRILGGDGLFGYMTRVEDAPAPAGRKSWEAAAIALDQRLGQPKTSLQRFLVSLVLVSLPVLAFAPGGRRILFFATGGFISLVLMFSTVNAGGSVHHVILLWPLPQLLIVLAAVEAVRFFGPRARQAAVAMLLAAAASNLAVLNHLYARFQAGGTTVTWSDAILPVIHAAGHYQGRVVFATEWGILNQMRFFGAGRFGMIYASDNIARTLHEQPLSRLDLYQALSNPQTIFIGHSAPAELFAGSHRTLEEFATRAGYTKTVLQTIQDRHLRPIFEIFEYRRPSQP